jgi:hypothetical protein
MWEDGERAKKRQKMAESAKKDDEKDDEKEKKKKRGVEEKEDEALNGLFNEIVRYSVVNSCVSAITELYTWQSEGGTTGCAAAAGGETLGDAGERPPRRGANSAGKFYRSGPVYNYGRLRLQEASTGDFLVLGDGL